ncbi:hypothetical protein LG311_19780 [Sutcliffiella horikoshii]|uniref:hypothetical protein n=1 Tax=Sutcliffiella horikoshii TaxID=79883 RepID=UPI003850032E
MLRDFINAQVTLEKQNGKHYEGIDACVQTKKRVLRMMVKEMELALTQMIAA